MISMRFGMRFGMRRGPAKPGGVLMPYGEAGRSPDALPQSPKNGDMASTSKGELP